MSSTLLSFLSALFRVRSKRMVVFAFGLLVPGQGRRASIAYPVGVIFCPYCPAGNAVGVPWLDPFVLLVLIETAGPDAGIWTWRVFASVPVNPVTLLLDENRISIESPW